MSNIHNVYISLNYDPMTQSKEKPWITLCMLGNCSYFLSSVFFFFFFFFKIAFAKYFIMDTIRVLNSMKLDQVHIFSDRMWFQTVYNNNQHTTTPAAAKRCLQICHCGHLERFDKLFTIEILTRIAGVSINIFRT